MIKLLLLFLVVQLINSISVFPQGNLVLNGSFEECLFCPPPIKLGDTLPAKHWYSPNIMPVAYYNPCSNIPGRSVPINHLGYVEAKSGNAYFGLGFYRIESSYTSYLQGQFKEPLIAGNKYEVSFWVRLAHNFSDLVAYNIGAHISTEKYIFGEYFWEKIKKSFYFDGMKPELIAHVKNESGYITDTVWIKISGIYYALGGETYINIGMFWDDNPKVINAFMRAKQNPSKRNIKRFGKLITTKNKHMIPENKNHPLKERQLFPLYLIDDVSVIKIVE